MALKFGPGAMVAAAFIGPGTLTTATAIGASNGISLAWTILFALITTLILQELAVRSSLSTQRDLAALARDFGGAQWGRWLIAPLIVAAIGVGNAAYQSGNLSGAAVGLTRFLPDQFTNVVLGISLIATGLILTNRCRWLERALVALVLVMALLFVGLSLSLLPELFTLPPSRVTPSFSSQDGLLVLALIGTTIVPYNLFLHATAARRKWHGVPLADALREARRESLTAISVGAAITVAIMVVAAALLKSPADQPVLDALIHQVENRLPGVGGAMIAIGLFSAGLSSALAAPLAAGWAVCGALGLPTDEHGKPFKTVALGILAVGAMLSVLASRPQALIVTAQAANAMLLPVVAVILLFVVNSQLVPAPWRNGRVANTLALLIIMLVVVLAGTRLQALLNA